MSDATFPFAIAVNSIPPEGRHFRCEADVEVRARLAAELDLVALAALAFEGEVKRLAGHRVSVRGQLTASVTQTDVVTLEPVENALKEDIDLVLAPFDEETHGRVSDATVAEPGPDVYRNGRVELGALAIEHLVLSLDPYPRAHGVTFEPHVEDAGGPEESPFAALSRLKPQS